KEAILKISIIDSMSNEDLKKLLATRFNNCPKKAVDFSMVGLINKRLIPVVLKEAGIADLKRPVANLASKDKERIARILTDWRFNIKGTKSWPSAQVTA